MSRRGGGPRGRGRGGAAAGGYDDPRGPLPARQGHRGGGGRGGGRGRRGGGAGHETPASTSTQPTSEAYYPAVSSPQMAAMAPPAAAAPIRQPPPQRDVGSSSSYVAAPRRPSEVEVASSSSSAAAALIEDLRDRLTVTDPAVMPPPTEAAGAPPPASTKAVRNAARPGFGTLGRKCIVRANHFLVEVADRDLCHYDVTITPESTSRAFNRTVIAELVKAHRSGLLGGRTPAYDGRKSLYTAGSLPFESKTLVVKVPEKDPKKGERELKVTIRFVGRADLHHLQQFLNGRQMDVPQETIQILDVALRELPSMNYVPVFRSFYSPSLGEKGNAVDGIEFWKGYYQSLRPTQMGLSLNIDISSTAFYEPLNVVMFISEHLGKDVSRGLSELDKAKIRKALRGIRVETIHNSDTPRRYRITGISSVAINQLMFPIDERGTQMSVVQYFKDKYDFTLKFGLLPALQAGTENRPKYLPMEACKIVEGQRYTQKLSDRQVSAILRETCQRPSDREYNTRRIVENNNYKDDVFAKEFGLKVKNQLTAVEARVLLPPKLKYHDSGRDKSCNPSVGQWNMINKKMVDGGTVDHWTCLSFSNRLRPDDVHRFCSNLIDMCNQIGMVINPTPVKDIEILRPDRLDSAFRGVNEHCNQIGKRIQLLIVILPDTSGFYGRIKRICETDLGIVTQCCQPRNVSRGSPQFLENLSLKINVKVGGRNTVLEDAVNKRIPLVTEPENPTIVFGADVTHPSPGEDTMPSIAAVVASMDPEFVKYRGLVSAQHHREEIIQDLYKMINDPERGVVHGGFIRELLQSYYQANRTKPKRIIFFRDGVSEGQFSQVLLYEVDAIRRACASLEEGYMPRVTFVVVQKRHHTRLFPEVHGERSLTDRSGNILPGTVVDTKICHPTEFDFYLCSHAGIQGTSKPTHYHVLMDENGFSADLMQMLVNSLCYTYARCTRSVSIVPPAYYAHLAAFRARYYMEDLSERASSSAGGVRSRQAPVVPRQLPSIHQSVKEVMFYC